MLNANNPTYDGKVTKMCLAEEKIVRDSKEKR